MQPGIQGALRELRAGMAEIYGERLVDLVLFGSPARDDAHPDSDVDVLVVLKGPVDPSLVITRTIDLVARLSLENDTVISCVFRSQELQDQPRTAACQCAARRGQGLTPTQQEPLIEAGESFAWGSPPHVVYPVPTRVSACGVD